MSKSSEREQPVNLAQIAHRAGTSTSAASRALNGRIGVKAVDRDRVLKAAEELGYRANPAARNLALNRTGLVALIIADSDLIIGSSIFGELVPGVISELESADYKTVLLLPRTKEEKDNLLRTVRKGSFDGVIIFGHKAKDKFLIHLEQENLPTIAVGRPIGKPTFSFVDLNEDSGINLAITHLLGRGRKTIATIAGPQNTSWGVDRLKLFRSDIKKLNPTQADNLFEVSELTTTSAYEPTKRLLKQHPEIDGLVVASETFLPNVLQVIADLNMTIPKDLGLVTFDEGPIQKFFRPSITSIRIPFEIMGTEAARLMSENLKSSMPLRSILLSPTLNSRDT